MERAASSSRRAAGATFTLKFRVETTAATEGQRRAVVAALCHVACKMWHNAPRAASALPKCPTPKIRPKPRRRPQPVPAPTLPQLSPPTERLSFQTSPARIPLQTGISLSLPTPRGIPSVANDGMLVQSSFLIRAGRELARANPAEGLAALARREPVLAVFLAERLATIAGRLALSGAPPEVVQSSHEEMLTLALTCIQALRRGHFELWKDTMTGTRLAQLDPEFKPKSRRGKQRPEDGSTGQVPF